MGSTANLLERIGDVPALDELIAQINDEHARYELDGPVGAEEGDVYLVTVITKGFRYAGTGIGIDDAIRTCGEAFASGLRQRWDD